MCSNHSVPKPPLCDLYTPEPTMTSVPTPSPTGTLKPTVGLTDVSCEDGFMKVYLKLQTDRYGHETSWTLKENATMAIIQSDDSLDDNKDIHYELCIPCSNYVFEIFDTYGDGIMAPGGYELLVDNTVLDSYSQLIDGGFESRKIDIFQSSYCPQKEPCSEDELTIDLTHYGLYSGTDLKWEIEDTLTKEIVQNQKKFVAKQLTKIRLCLPCSRYIFRLHNDESFAKSGGLDISIDGESLQKYNLLLDVGEIKTSAFSGQDCPAYYRIKSDQKHRGFDYCLEPKNCSTNALVVVRRCDDSYHQLWRPDQYGQYHAVCDDNLCITKVINQVRLKYCSPGPFRTRNKNVAYSQFTKQMIWMKDGRKSLATKADLREGNEVSLKFYSSATDKNQLWTFEEI